MQALASCSAPNSTGIFLWHICCGTRVENCASCCSHRVVGWRQKRRNTRVLVALDYTAAVSRPRARLRPLAGWQWLYVCVGKAARRPEGPAFASFSSSGSRFPRVHATVLEAVARAQFRMWRRGRAWRPRTARGSVCELKKVTGAAQDQEASEKWGVPMGELQYPRIFLSAAVMAVELMYANTSVLQPRLLSVSVHS